jgi:DUF1707 SHOCT-like domain/2TM domain
MLPAAENHIDFAALTSRLRVSDRDRDSAARHLRDAAGSGALGVHELDRRLDRVLLAATRGELEAVLLDLPIRRPVRRSSSRRWLSAHLGAYAIVNAGLIAIWAAAGFGYFWPVWPIIGWGMLTAGHAYGVFVVSPDDDLGQRR